MRKNFKVLISILLCFMMLFGEIVPAGLPSAKALAETDNVLEVQDSSFNQENNNFSPEKTVSEDVYEEEELLQNPDEEIPGLKAASSTMSVSSVFSISGKVVLPEGKVAPSGGLTVRVYAKSSSKTNNITVIIPEGKAVLITL